MDGGTGATVRARSLGLSYAVKLDADAPINGVLSARGLMFRASMQFTHYFFLSEDSGGLAWCEMEVKSHE